MLPRSTMSASLLLRPWAAAVLAAVLLLPVGIAQAGSLNFYNVPGNTLLMEDGVTALDNAFKFEFGTFETGFTPTTSNITDWTANWKPFARAEAPSINGWNSAISYFNKSGVLLGSGMLASARMPTACVASSATSRTHPSITTPAQPFFAAAAPRLPPSNARRSEPPPSTTSTRPKPAESTMAFTSELSSWHFTVTTAPLNRRTAPKSRNTGGSMRKLPELSFLWASHRSQVAGWLLIFQ